MIKITKLNKYYYKSSHRENHIINDTSIELPDTGFVTLVGKSGCGKSTLLNVIGGLDKYDSGSISYDDNNFSKYNMRKIDAYRKDNIGYIFQNYLLIENMSVIDNLKEALNIIHIYDKEEQEKRIKYALEAVGLWKCRKKLASRLSGGEMQRVSIARALVKKCKLILADEPTGNLDSENTIEVMQILKNISKTTLVILVTHNEEIARAFSERIITISDGKIIKDEISDGSDAYIKQNDKTIHLLDLQKEEVIKTNNIVEIYKDEISDAQKIKLIIRNNTIYIDTNSKVVNIKDAGIEVINDHYKPIDIKQIENKFDISWYNDIYSNNIFKNILSEIKSSFKKFYYTSKKSKIFHIIFMLVGIIMASTSINFANSLVIEYDDITTEDVYMVYNEEDKTPYQKIISNVENDKIDEIYYLGSNSFNIEIRYNSKRSKTEYFKINYYPYSRAVEYDLLYGNHPKTDNQTVVGKDLAQKLIDKFNLNNYDDLKQLIINNNYAYSKEERLEIVGVSSKNTNSLYLFDDYYYRCNNYLNGYFKPIYDENNEINYFNLLFYDYFKDEITITEGVLPSKYNELIVSNVSDYNIGDIIYGNNLEECTIVGKYTYKNNTMPKNEFMTLDSKLASEIYISKNEFFYISSHMWEIKYSFMPDFKYAEKVDYTGKLPKYGEVLVNKKLGYGIGDKIELLFKTYNVSGYYSSDELLVTDVIVSKEQYNQSKIDVVIGYYGANNTQIAFSNNPKVSDLEIDNAFNVIYKTKQDEKIAKGKSAIITSIILLAVTIIYSYFTMRSRLILNIKKVGVYRSIGAKKIQIYKTYFFDILIESLFTSVLGYVIAITIYSIGVSKAGEIFNLFINAKSIGIFILGTILLLTINVIVGLLPVIRLLSKTPSEINSKYDV